MKLSKSLTIGLLTTCSLFALSPANANSGSSANEAAHADSYRSDDNNKKDNDNSSGDADSGKSASSSLPIDKQVWFLILVAGIVGCKVVYDKSKAAEKAQLDEDI
jgi:hypothetical protein